MIPPSDRTRRNKLWGGQSWPQPAFEPAQARLKASRGQDCPPHNFAEPSNRQSNTRAIYNSPMKLITLACALSLAAFAAAPETIKTSAGDLKITPIQHATMMIQAGGQTNKEKTAKGN